MKKIYNRWAIFREDVGLLGALCWGYTGPLPTTTKTFPTRKSAREALGTCDYKTKIKVVKVRVIIETI